MGFSDFLKQQVGKTKDLAVLLVINRSLAGIGSVSELVIERAERRISGKLSLNGETDAIDIVVHGWEYGDESNPNRVRILGMTTSKAWLNSIAERAILGRWFEVPAEHFGKLRMALD